MRTPDGRLVQRLTVNPGEGGKSGTLTCQGCGAPVAVPDPEKAEALIAHQRDCPEIEPLEDMFPGYGLARERFARRYPEDGGGHGYQEAGDF